MDGGAAGDPLPDRRHSGVVPAKDLAPSAPVTLAHDHDNLVFAQLVFSAPPVDPVGT